MYLGIYIYILKNKFYFRFTFTFSVCHLENLRGEDHGPSGNLPVSVY